VDDQVHFPLPHGIELIKWPDAKAGLDSVVIGSEAGLHVMYFDPSVDFSGDTGKSARQCSLLSKGSPIQMPSGTLHAFICCAEGMSAVNKMYSGCM
jgi:hypothetical protein